MRSSAVWGVAGVLLPASVFAQMSLTSGAFKEGTDIPLAHACAGKGGENTSIPLAWSGAPKETKQFAVVMDDEVAPCGEGDGACRHWGVYNIPSSVSAFVAGQSFDAMKGVTLGKSYSGATGYDGMCPPNPHVYKITVYALKDGMPEVEVDAELTRSQFEANYKDHILESATLSGTFSP
jgi:Raf kinase inhibitor-like YbhB/YbcL family protein